MKTIRRKIVLLFCVLAIGFTSCEYNSNNTVLDDNEYQWQNKVAFPSWSVLIEKIIEVLTDALEGKYHEKIYYSSDGKMEYVERWCEGVFGHCKIGISDNKGQSISVCDRENKDKKDNIFNAHLIKCNIGIIYAISKKDSDAVDNFFYSHSINIGKEFKIDRPDVLKELGLKEPISIKGDYKVYQSPDYVFIILQHKK